MGVARKPLTNRKLLVEERGWIKMLEVIRLKNAYETAVVGAVGVKAS